MRLNKNQVEHMAFIIVRNLAKEGKVILEDRGRIVETGTHAELIRAGGIYCKLYELQFKPTAA